MHAQLPVKRALVQRLAEEHAAGQYALRPQHRQSCAYVVKAATAADDLAAFLRFTSQLSPHLPPLGPDQQHPWWDVATYTGHDAARHGATAVLSWLFGPEAPPESVWVAAPRAAPSDLLYVAAINNQPAAVTLLLDTGRCIVGYRSAAAAAQWHAHASLTALLQRTVPIVPTEWILPQAHMLAAFPCLFAQVMLGHMGWVS
jgi:hypothetical protein